ncbi:hypothetical protein [Pyrococcus horikoshii]|uniref:Uncharacterized protein n=2 Tax=Pyrococcus horikoshii TaxID=53953 RepID=O58229_PYRHO|nr:hypothetical protein [Pyrococcus horikoshii]BAA29581.1 246aa long hypothetical protein [Pyrococcus horikoshii OT3]HII60930.1 hypothetical protein [Pyrococcus horikoshii]
MDVWTVILVVVAVIVGSLIAAWIVSSVVSQQMKSMQALLLSKSIEAESRVERKRKEVIAEKQKNPVKEETKAISEEDIVKRIKQVIDEKVQNVLNEAKKKKERLLMLLDVARGYALGFVSEDEYNAFLMKVLGELDEFKRLWLARYPSPEDRDRLNQIMAYVARTKLPIEVREKGKEGTTRLSPDEALIRMTSSINNAISILDDLIKKRGENPAITPLEIQLSQEVEKLRKKVEDLEKRLQELEAL